MSRDERTLEITVAATENSLRIFDIAGPEAAQGARWEELPQTRLHATPEMSLRNVLELASAQLGITVQAELGQALAQLREERGEAAHEEKVVDRLAFAEFRRPDDDDVMDSVGTKRRNKRLRSTSVVIVRNELGQAVWKRPPFDATMAELLDAAEAGLIEGDPLQPYLVLVVPQGDFGLFAEWHRFLETLKLLWEVSGAMAQAGGALAFLDLVRRAFKRRGNKPTEVVEKNAQVWSERGAGPDDVIELLQQKPRKASVIASLLGCTTGEAEALLWGLGCAEIDGCWHWRGDALASFIADDLELRPMLGNYRGEDRLRSEYERRLRELGQQGESTSAEDEKREMYEEFRRQVEAEIDEGLGGD
jgi:hypothetical protein